MTSFGVRREGREVRARSTRPGSCLWTKGVRRSMPLRLVAGVVALVVAATGALLSTTSSAESAPDKPGKPGEPEAQHWTEADKTGFGTARTTGSNVWFTLQDGLVSEVFYPDLS